MDELSIAYHKLTDLGLAGEDKRFEDSYRFSKDLLAMTDAVKIVRNHGYRLPEQVQADLHLKYFNNFKELNSFEDTWRPLCEKRLKRH
jgi:hypothetical protein